ncbi:MAG: hypothetical protein ACK4SY_06850 [Pyrobaculum sp.]
MRFFDVKAKRHFTASNYDVVYLRNGAKAAVAKSPYTGIKVYRILGKEGGGRRKGGRRRGLKV